jgi:predicted transglutaminase-like cysteine proteinase
VRAHILIILALAMFAARPAEAAVLDPPAASAARPGQPTSIPYGWVDFCSRRPSECEAQYAPPAPIHLTPEVWNLLGSVNATVNAAIEPVSNLEHWGTMLDHWDYPVDGKGDCKVYALTKRKMLLDRGLPRQALLMTIVRDLNGDGHAILTVRTDRGDFTLDNLAEGVRAWDATGYRFVKRQAEWSPNVWLELEGWGTMANRGN